MSLRTRLALVFVAATLVPLGATLWLTSLLLNESLRPADQLAGLSRSLEKTGIAYYRLACDQLRAEALSGHSSPQLYVEASKAAMPAAVAEFWEGEEADSFARTGEGESQLLYICLLYTSPSPRD